MHAKVFDTDGFPSTGSQHTFLSMRVLRGDSFRAGFAIAIAFDARGK